MPPHVRPPKRRDYIRELQSLDEPIKQRVLIAASAITMMLVVYIWIGYFNSIVMGGPTQLADQSASVQAGAVPSAITGDVATSAVTTPSAPGFWQMLGGGIDSLYHGAVSGFKGAGSALQAPKQYDITPTGQSAPTQ